MGNMINDSIFAQQVWEDIKNKKYQYVYFDGSFDSEKAYEDQQGIIGSEFQNALKLQGTQMGGIGKAINNFRLKETESSNTEQQLLAQMGFKINNYSTLPMQEKIKLWTNVFLFDSTTAKNRRWSPNNKRDREVAFALFINSTEFIKLYRTAAAYSTLKSGEYMKATGQTDKDKAREEFMNMFINGRGKHYTQFRNAVINSMQEYFEDSGEMTNYITRQLSDAFTAARGNMKAYVTTAAKRDYSKSAIYEHHKKELKQQMEKLMRDIYDYKRKNDKDWARMAGDTLESLQVNMNQDPNGPPFIVMTITPEIAKSKVYHSAPGASADEKRKSFIEAVKEIFIKLNKQSITAGFVKNLVLEGADFWSCIESYINSELVPTTNMIFQNNSTFFTQDWNASAMTGMLGELSSYLTHGRRVEDVSMTGTTADQIMINGEMKGLGESFRDLTFMFNGSKYGINVKRYTTRESNDFTLYDDKDGIGINSQYMYRYFTYDEVQLIRFIALNRKFIAEGLSSMTIGTIDYEMIDLYKTLSASHIDNFIRLSSAAVEGINLFYVINNITIPASAIYTYLIMTLMDMSNTKNLFDIAINKTPDYKSPKLDTEPGREGDLPATVESSNNLLTNSVKIKFKGLSLRDLGKIYR